MDADVQPQILQRASARFALLAYLLRERDAADPWEDVRDACAMAEAGLPPDDATEPCRSLLTAVAACVRESGLETAYRRTFGHIPAGHFSPYETSYGAPNAFTQSQTLADLNGFYRAFGVEPAAAYRERHDHLSLQCEFVALLLCKEGLARHEGNAEGVEVCRAARRRFLEEHLGRWGGVLFERLERDAPGELYRRCGRVGVQVLAAEVEAVGARRVAAGCGTPPPPGIAEEFCPELFACPGTSDTPELDC